MCVCTVCACACVCVPPRKREKVSVCVLGRWRMVHATVGRAVWVLSLWTPHAEKWRPDNFWSGTSWEAHFCFFSPLLTPVSANQHVWTKRKSRSTLAIWWETLLESQRLKFTLINNHKIPQYQTSHRHQFSHSFLIHWSCLVYSKSLVHDFACCVDNCKVNSCRKHVWKSERIAGISLEGFRRGRGPFSPRKICPDWNNSTTGWKLFKHDKVSTVEEIVPKDLKGTITNLLRLCNHIIAKHNGDSPLHMRKSINNYVHPQTLRLWTG